MKVTHKTEVYLVWVTYKIYISYCKVNVIVYKGRVQRVTILLHLTIDPFPE